MDERIFILDFGAQYTQLIARRVREAGVFSEIFPCTDPLDDLRGVKGIILSGGPSSVYDPGAPQLDTSILELNREDDSPMPILGICYGLQAMVHALGGEVRAAEHREFGHTRLTVTSDQDLLKGIPKGTRVWMSHGDMLTSVPEGYQITARTSNAPVAAARHHTKPHYGVQFHPEVVHTEHGHKVFENFARTICGCRADWSPASFIEEKTRELRTVIGQEHVILGLSGGVDSSVAARLIHDAVGDQLTCIFVDNGLLRHGEFESVQEACRTHLHANLEAIDASDLFLRRLSKVTDPEEKRVIIGNTFVEVFEEATEKIAHKLGSKPRFLAQGTLYPDVIESVAYKGPSATIKTHHNVGGIPDEHGFTILEPFRELFKDEVRVIGQVLDLPESILQRHPFPGPGLAVRILGPVDSGSLQMLRAADRIFMNELRRQGLYDEVWQALAVLLPVETVGVMGDERTYERVCVLRAVTSTDGMTADWARLPHDFLGHVAGRIVNEVKGINRVAYDISSKPPATIEWE